MSFLKDLTGGNPFSTRVGHLIEQSTDGIQASENWAMFMEVCDVINETEEGPKDACKAIKKRFSTSGKNYTTIMYTLTVLETCVKNCGRRFHVQIAHKDFLQEMVKIIGPKNDPPTAVQEKVLSMIQNWADAFQGQPEMKEISKMYQELKNKGIEFPMTDLDSMAPIHTPARTGSIDTMPATRPSQVPAQQAVQTMPRPVPLPQQPVQQPQAHPQPPSGPVAIGTDQLTKLKSELDVVQQNTRVFSEMLTEMTPGQESQADVELLEELSRTCKQMQHRIMELIDKIQNEEITCELLHINDELNNVFLRYERFERLRAGQTSQKSPQSSNSFAPPTYNSSVAVPGANPTLPPAEGAKNAAPAVQSNTTPAVANLIDFGETPSPKPQQSDPFSLQPSQLTNNGLNSQLEGLSLGAGTGTTLDGLKSTQATTGSQKPPNPSSDDFDMFAQSRQSFDHNKQTLPGQGSNTYSAQQQDSFAGGLGKAVNAKTTGNPFSKEELIDTEKDFEEMEKWLQENPNATQQQATSSEFDQFLQDRVSDTMQNSARTSATNNRRQMQKDNQEDAMFAL